MKRIFTITTLLLLMNGFAVHSQQVISNGGANMQVLSGSISFTLGESIIATLSISGGIITQGFHQTKLTVTAIEENYSNSVKVYPNPITDRLYVSLGSDELSHISLALFDLNGRILSVVSAGKELVEVDFSPYQPGTYILKVLRGNSEIATYKIVKIK